MNKLYLPLFALFFGLSPFCVEAQESDSLSKKWNISGYLETYYIYDFANPAEHNRPDFFYSFHRHNELNINFAYLQAEYDAERIRGKFALMAGSYANANLAAEPGVLKNIYEANAGIKLSKSKNLWLDAGVFASHIGFESARGADCWNMTRSILAENSPYFLSGAKLSYESDNAQWLFSATLANGWQRIQRVPGNQLPAFGHQLTWTPKEGISLNSSSLICSDSPDTSRLTRYFHNFYGQFDIHAVWGFIVGFDIGAEQSSPQSQSYNLWYAPVLIARYQANENLAFAARVEYYEDQGGVIIAPDFGVLGYSINADFRLFKQVLWRIEARMLQSQRTSPFVNSQANATRENIFIGTSLSIAFE